jgi:hypothetical protein
MRRRKPLDRLTLPTSRYASSSAELRRASNFASAPARFAVMCMSNSTSPMAGTVKGAAVLPLPISASFTSMR